MCEKRLYKLSFPHFFFVFVLVETLKSQVFISTGYTTT